MQHWLVLVLASAKQRGLTQKKVAEDAGISADTLYTYLRGEGHNAGIDTIMAIARAAGVPEPRIERSLRFSGGTVGAPPALMLLREAGAAIEAAARLLERDERQDARARDDRGQADARQGGAEPDTGLPPDSRAV